MRANIGDPLSPFFTGERVRVRGNPAYGTVRFHVHTGAPR